MSTRETDIRTILSKRSDNGGDFWASSDGRIYVGNPFSTVGALLMLHELGLERDHEAVQGGLQLILQAAREDGRIRVAPRAPMYPCYTAEAARVLCRFGLADHDITRRTVQHLRETAHDSGGWRCSFSKFGKGPETLHANPGATLYILDLLRFESVMPLEDDVTDQAVGLLLGHWDSRAPLGPCHWGIGSLFMQVEFPFLRYNLFYFVYVLSFFETARSDPRFSDAVRELETHLDSSGQLVVDRPHRTLKSLAFCAQGEPSPVATRRYHEIIANLRR